MSERAAGRAAVAAAGTRGGGDGACLPLERRDHRVSCRQSQQRRAQVFYTPALLSTPSAHSTGTQRGQHREVNHTPSFAYRIELGDAASPLPKAAHFLHDHALPAHQPAPHTHTGADNAQQRSHSSSAPRQLRARAHRHRAPQPSHPTTHAFFRRSFILRLLCTSVLAAAPAACGIAPLLARPAGGDEPMPHAPSGGRRCRVVVMCSPCQWL